MSVQVQLRRDTYANVAANRGAAGEVFVDTTNQRIVVQDGATNGGFPAPVTLSVQNGGNTNNSSSGSGSFFNHTPTFTIPANFMIAARAFRLTAHFQLTTGTTVPILTVRLSLGSTVISSIGNTANITGTTYGFFFNNPSIAGAKYTIFVNDATAPIKTIGQVQANTLQLDSGTKTATAVAGAATLSKASGKITSEALTTAAGATYTLTLTNTQIAAADTVFVSIANGTNTAGDPVVGLVTPAAGSATIKIVNRHATDAFNGTIVISFMSLKV